MTLLCYTQEDQSRPHFEFRLRHPINKTGSIWHCRIPADNLSSATLYAYRVEGPNEPHRGHRFDPQKLLLDPYSPSVYFPSGFSREECRKPGPNDGRVPLGLLPKKSPRLDPALKRGPRVTSPNAIIYELHVKGFTARANSGISVAKRGTFAGLIEKIPYLQESGRHRCRVTSCPAIRSSGRKLLGIYDAAFFLSPSAIRIRRCFRGISRDGACFPCWQGSRCGWM